MRFSQGSARDDVYRVSNRYEAATWNVAAINNNPFEYWVTYPEDAYNEFMQGVEDILHDNTQDVVVHSIFTDVMFSELVQDMRNCNIENLDLLSNIWETDYKWRYAINGYLKDRSLGEKRLASMPDRITNTINCKDCSVIRRPTVINAYNGGSLHSPSAWWEKWRKFMFDTYVEVFSRDNRDATPQLVCNLITPILRTKYPAITAHEQEMSVALQILCLAILDAIFVHIVNHVAPLEWETIRSTLSHALIHGKDDRICSILAQSYADCDVVFIQEASAALVRKLAQHPELGNKYALLMPADFDGKRDQNSVILAACRRFQSATCVDVTPQVFAGRRRRRNAHRARPNPHPRPRGRRS